jgi:hypothetical protein
MAGAKVTEFDLANELVGPEIVGIIQAGENRQTTAADIAALALGDAANQELIRDTIGTALVAGTGITITVDDVADTITVDGTVTQYSNELAQDTVAGMITDDGLITVTYTDGTPELNFSVPSASAAEVSAGSSTTKAVTPDALAGSDLGKAVFVLQVSDPNGSTITTGDGKAYFTVPDAIDGWNLVLVEMSLTTASSVGLPTTQIANVTQAVDMLSTKVSIDANGTHSKDATTPAVIDAANDDVAAGDLLRIDNDVSGTGAKGQTVILTFQLP